MSKEAAGVWIAVIVAAVLLIGQCTEAGKVCIQSGGLWNHTGPGSCVPADVFRTQNDLPR